MQSYEMSFYGGSSQPRPYRFQAENDEAAIASADLVWERGHPYVRFWRKPDLFKTASFGPEADGRTAPILSIDERV
jgi:hypothetical protein